MNRKVHVRFRGEVLEKCLTAEKLYGNSPALLPYALLEAIGRDEALLDPSELFRKSEAQGEIDSEDAAYWNVELTESEGEPLTAEYAAPFMQVELQPMLEADPLIQETIRLAGVVTEIEQPERNAAATILPDPASQSCAQTIFDYLDTVHIITDDQKLSTLRAELLTLMQASPARLGDWLRDNRVVFPGCESEVAAKLVGLSAPIETEVVHLPTVMELRPVAVSTRSSKSAATKSRKLNLLAVPEDVPQPKRHQPERQDETAPLQLTLF